MRAVAQEHFHHGHSAGDGALVAIKRGRNGELQFFRQGRDVFYSFLFADFPDGGVDRLAGLAQLAGDIDIRPAVAEAERGSPVLCLNPRQVRRLFGSAVGDSVA